jgi:hypothetical protein
VDKILDVSLVTLKDMQTGDLLAEIELWEREPKLQRCVLSEHDQAGQVFNLVHGRVYIVVVHVFRESSAQPNPVSQVRFPLCRVLCSPDLRCLPPLSLTRMPLPPHAGARRITAEGGQPMLLSVGVVPAELSKALPNCVSAAAVWNPAQSGSTSFLQAIKYPAVRKAQFDIQLELTDLPGQTTSLTPQLNFLPHATEKAALKIARAKLWADDKYMQLTPDTKNLTNGAIFVARLAAKAAML